MNNDVNIILHEIISIWHNIEESRRPWGMWICENHPIIDCQLLDVRFTNNPKKVWFCDRGKLISKSLEEYRRFYYVQIVRPWCSRSWGENSSIFGNKDSFGLVYFASLVNCDRYYLTWQFGHLWGEGFTFKIDRQRKIVTRQVVFIS